MTEKIIARVFDALPLNGNLHRVVAARAALLAQDQGFRYLGHEIIARRGDGPYCTAAVHIKVDENPYKPS